MKNRNKFLGIVTLLVLVVCGCKKSFNSLYQNPNLAHDVPPSLLLNGVLFNLYDAPYTSKERWCQYYCCCYDYYGNNRYDFGSGDDYYSTLKNVVKMEESAVKNGGDSTLNPYRALGKFFRAYFFTQMSLQMGDIPMTQALDPANFHPVYNTQKEVFVQAFDWLEQANADLSKLINVPSGNTSSGQTLKGDFYFNNELIKWQKVVNAYRIRILLALSKKVADPDLKIKDQFAKIIHSPDTYPLMTSGNDNLQFIFVYPTNFYPNNPGNFGFDALRYNMSGTYVKLLTQLKDPRVFVTAEPAQALVAKGASPSSFAAFSAPNPGIPLGDMYTATNAGENSLLNRKHYYDTYTGEPSVQIGYPEMMFNIAEGINLGWAASGTLGGPSTYYEEGIKASWQYYAIPVTAQAQFTAYFLKPGASLGNYNPYSIPVDFNTYYNQSSVKYAGNNETGRSQILTQKYLALFRHSGLESFFTYRRTKIPQFTTGSGTGNSGRIPLRFQYPGNEKTTNTENYQKAITAYDDNDDINGTMWILK